MGVSVEDDGVALGRETVFVGIAAYAGDAFKAEVKELRFETGAREKRDNERAETAVDVEWDLAFDGKTGEGGYVVDDAVGEIGG